MARVKQILVEAATVVAFILIASYAMQCTAQRVNAEARGPVLIAELPGGTKVYSFLFIGGVRCVVTEAKVMGGAAASVDCL